MRISFLIRKPMMDAVRSHPVGRTALHRQGAAKRQEILDRFWSSISPMREQAMVAHANAETASNPIKNHCHYQSLPSEHEKGGQRPNMEQAKDCNNRPIDRFVPLPLVLRHEVSLELLCEAGGS